jgi:NAD(P)-dependent dehydrogenase (short-subunit alcohol dehydrogenase family)
MSNDNKIALVTGASRGIGKAIMTMFKKRGITVIGISRSISLSKTTRRCDITHEIAVRKLTNEIIKLYGTIDILVNNAGIVTHADIVNTTLDDWDRVLTTNLTGAFLCSKYILPLMKKNRYGKIINISSIAGRFRSSMASVGYTASKYGLIGLTRQLAFRYAKYGININAVCPSQTRTEMLVDNIPQKKMTSLVSTIPARRLAKPEDIAEVAYFLASDASSYINGAVIDVNGAQF